MSLRIRDGGRRFRGQGQGPSDSWPARLAKLIPAESLALYGAAQAIVPPDKPEALWAVAGACLLFTGVLRWRETRDEHGGNPQWIAIGIALVSFCLWVATLKPPTGPLALGPNAFYPGLATLFWTAFAPLVYRGSST